MTDTEAQGSSPFIVVSTDEFWKNNYAFFLILTICALTGVILAPYMLDPRQGGWIVLSILTIIFGVYGAFRTFYEISKIEIENFLIRSITDKASDYIRRSQQVELDELKERISPPNDTEPTPAMIRLIDRVVDEARISRFDSSVTLMQTYREEAVDIIFKLQNYQKIVLWIGIAGTFIGILDAIKPEEIRKLIDMDPAQFGNFLSDMFNGLSISFSASLAGLVSATVLGCFVLLVKKKQELYFKNMESVATLILTATRKSKNGDKFLSEIEYLKRDLETSQTLTQSLQRSIFDMQKQIILQNGQIQDSVNKFFASNDKVNRIVTETEKELGDLHNSLALKTTLETGIKEAGQRLADSISGQLTTFSQQMTLFRQSAESINENVKIQSEQTSRLNASMTSRLGEIGNVIRTVRYPQGFFNKLLDKILK